MRLILILLAMVAVVAVAAIVTRPGRPAFDAMLDRVIRERVASTDIGDGDRPLPELALAACKLRPTDCVTLVRAALEVRFDEGLFMTRVSVDGLGRTMTCRGAFSRFFCRGTE